jgi:hypothetical protein
LKCYRHPNVDAVGVCSQCGRGVCTACAMSVKGRLYCKADVERLVSREGEEAKPVSKRHRAITLAAIFFILLGVGELCLSIFLMYTGVVPGSYKSLLQYSPFTTDTSLIDTSVSIAPFVAGGLLFVVATVGIVAGDSLWSRKKGGMILGGIEVVSGTIVAAALESFNRSGIALDLFVAVLFLNLALVFLLVVGRRSLT